MESDVLWDMWEAGSPVKEEPMTLYASLMESLEDMMLFRASESFFDQTKNESWMIRLEEAFLSLDKRDELSV